MFKFAPALAIAVATTIPSTSAFFSTKITTPVNKRSFMLSYQNEPGMQSPATYQPPPDAAFEIAGTYERAIDCANNYGLCAIDELIDLSEELDEYLGCFIEDGPEACESEINERHELAEALLVQGEMREHQRYIDEGNIFDFDVPVSGGFVENSNIMDTGIENSATQPRTSVWREEEDFFWTDEPNNLRP